MRIPLQLPFILIFLLPSTACQEKSRANSPDFHIVSAMRNVMHKGELGPKISLDSLAGKAGVYGIGPLSFLAGEITLFDGRPYVSRVGAEDSLFVSEEPAATAPFFVYAAVDDWQKVDIPAGVNNLASLEAFIATSSVQIPRPFAFRLSGSCLNATIHCQNLPPGTTVSSPAEAHQGQVNFVLNDQEIDLVGFFSTEHHGVFTHHDTDIHVHLLTKARDKMGHLDALEFEDGGLSLFLPVNEVVD